MNPKHRLVTKFSKNNQASEMFFDTDTSLSPSRSVCNSPEKALNPVEPLSYKEKKERAESCNLSSCSCIRACSASFPKEVPLINNELKSPAFVIEPFVLPEVSGIPRVTPEKTGRKIFRCASCHTFANMNFRIQDSMARFTCNICQKTSALCEPLENYSKDDVELNFGTYEILKPKKYK